MCLRAISKNSACQEPCLSSSKDVDTLLGIVWNQATLFRILWITKDACSAFRCDIRSIVTHGASISSMMPDALCEGKLRKTLFGLKYVAFRHIRPAFAELRGMISNASVATEWIWLIEYSLSAMMMTCLGISTVFFTIQAMADSPAGAVVHVPWTCFNLHTWKPSTEWSVTYTTAQVDR